MSTIIVDVISDVVCPWCFIGKRHLDQAVQTWREERPGSTVTVRWHPFFLNPDTPEEGEPYRAFLENKFGGPEKLAEIWQRVSQAGSRAGIDFAFEKIELRANTLNAHRLIHRAQKVGADGTAGDASALVEALFAAQFIEGRHVGDRSVLAEIAGRHGMDDALAYLATDEDRDVVVAMAAQARRQGITGVPFFIFDQRLAASGAQPPEALLQSLRQVA